MSDVMLYVYWFSSSGECGGVPHHNDCSFSLWVSGSVGDVPPQNESPLPACQVRKSVFEHHCFFGFTQSILYFVYQKGNMPLLFRVLVLYLGNLYSLIIALLDKVNSMSSAVSQLHSYCILKLFSRATWLINKIEIVVLLNAFM